MAKDKGAKPEANAAPANVVPINSNCRADGCKKKGSRAEFCEEHYVWFKEGLLTKEGKKPIDFDKKYQAWVARRKVA